MIRHGGDFRYPIGSIFDVRLDWGFLIGVGIGLAGLFISFLNFISNRQFQKRKDKREQELHELEMKKLSGECNAEK